MGALYPNHRPRGVRHDWEITSMEVITTGRHLRNCGVSEDWDNPTEAVAWFANHGDGDMRLLVADYSNGKRVTLRLRGRDVKIAFEQVS